MVRERGEREDWGWLGEMGGGEGGRIVMGAGKFISQLREPF